MSASVMPLRGFISGGVLRRFLFCSALAITVFICLSFFLPEISQAAVNTNPGDQYVFGADSPVSPDSNDQSSPSINGNFVLWSEYDAGTRRSISYYKDLSKGKDEPKHALYNDDNAGGWPVYSQSAHRVLWTESFSNGLTPTTIYYKDVDLNNYAGCSGALGACATAIPTTAGLYDPIVYLSLSPDGSKAVWQQGGGNYPQLYYYDFNTGLSQAVNSVAMHAQEEPSIDNNWVVWTERWDINDLNVPRHWAIYAKNLNSSGPPTTVAQNDGTVFTSVKSASLGHDAAGREVVAYAKNDNSLVLHYLDNGADIQLESGTGINQIRMDTDKIVYTNLESGGWKIHLYDITSNVSQTVSTGTSDWHPVVSASSKYIAWERMQSSPYQLYYNCIGDTARKLADRFSPELKMTSGEKEENFAPMPIEQFLTTPGTILRKRYENSLPDTLQFKLPNPTAQDLAKYAAVPDLFIDLPGNSIDAGGGDPSISIDRGYIIDFCITNAIICGHPDKEDAHATVWHTQATGEAAA